MAESNDIRERLLKVLRLAQEGVGGERENAAVLLDKLLRKHSMTMAELEGSGGHAATRTFFPATDSDESTVLSQVAISLFGTQRRMWRGSGSFDVALDVTPSEMAALTIAWDVYRAAFTEARHALMIGFCYKHGLYAAEASTEADRSPEARARAERAMALAEALPVVGSPAKRLPST
jgi:hypothetical protein